MSSAKIQRLPEIVINRIAAGEVVERPASIVRELVENSIDAGATHIFIHAEDGGNAIQVRDDGIGMNAEDLDIAVERHATSKLPIDIDGSDILKHIHSFGFRGEALASIAAVARLTLTSRTKDGAQGAELKINFGKKTPITPTAAQQGTIIRIDDLFHALPARRKFLKSARYELSLIADSVKKLALSKPKIGFELSGTSARPILYPAAQDINQRIQQIMGKNFLENATAIKDDYRNIKLSGMASLPTYHRPNTNEQFMFVNGRPVRDRILAGAVRAAYADVIFRSRHPALFLFLDVPQGDVDVNVHPAKTEVRFRDAASVRLVLIGAIKKAMAQAGHKTATPHGEKAFKALEQSRDRQIDSYAHQPDPSQNHQMMEALEQSRPPPAELEPRPVEPRSAEPLHTKSAQESSAQRPKQPTDSLLGVPRGQLHNTYIISQTKDAIVITDQHAAHERILHERLKASFKNKNPKRQSLLVPELIDLTQEQIELLMDNQENLAALGFAIERYGQASLLISEVPSLCRNSDMTDIMRTLVDDFSQEGGEAGFESLLDRISGNIACHAAIRAGQSLSFSEMDSLLRKMATTPNSGSCNHGRPTYIELKLANIEKLFHRR
jgi:DNA mismatch repair protein MutL